MKTVSLIKALVKHGLIVLKRDRECIDHLSGEKSIGDSGYFCAGKLYKVHWYDQEGEVICAQVQRVEESNDGQSDYFPGYFADTIKEIVNDLIKE